MRRRQPRPTQGRLQDVRVLRGVVQSVDKLRHAYTVADEVGGVHQNIQYAPTYITTDGSGSFVSPERNSVVWLMFPSTGRTPFIFAFSVPPKQTDEGDEGEEPDDFRQNRPVINEGDQVLASGRNGGFAILRSSGVLEVGASQLAKRVYLPLRHTIRDFFENWFGHGVGGSLTWEARREDDQHGVDRTPIEFKLDVKEFAEDEPIIKLRVGRVAEEDAEALPQGALGAIIGSLNINEKVKLWVDRNGTVASVIYGPTTASFMGPRVEYFSSQLTTRVRGRLIEHLGDRRTTVTRDCTTTVGGNHTTQARGVISQESGTAYRRQVGTDELVEVGGKSLRSVATDQTISVGGNQRVTVGGDAGESVGGDANRTVTGVWTLLVANQNGADLGASLKVAQGKLLMQSVLGDIVIGVGPTEDSLISKITMKLDGTVKVEGPLGTTSVEMNSTGVKVATPGGSLVLDAGGNVQMGPAGPAGGVVTTLTHPVDFMTGIPIKGSAQVGAGGAPSVTAIPPTFSPTGG